MDPLIATLFLFPTIEHHRVWVSPYGHVSSRQALNVTDLPLGRLNGLDIGWRHFHPEEELDLFSDDDDDENDFSLWNGEGVTRPMYARLFVDRDGTVQLDQLRLETALGGLRVRPELGDNFDLGLLSGYQETTLAATDTGRFQLRMITPLDLTLLGFSNTDFDRDDRMKYYISAGAGVGGEVLGKVLGPIGVFGRAVGFARTMNRHQRDARNQVRHEVVVDAELGLSVFGRNQAFWLSAWGELNTQWETRDADGKDGLDRQVGAWGIRLNGRFHPTSAGKPADDAVDVEKEMPDVL
ncbi:MAG: hypothetical protein AAFV53_34680 [Myxococcota bacterium]